MSLLILGIALALQGPATHASLHPADIDVFLEVPDLPALITAYDGAPMVRLLHDDNVALSIQELTGEEFDLDAQWNTALQSMLSPEAIGLVQSVHSLSISLKMPPANAEGSMSVPMPSFTVIVDFAGEEQARAVLAVMIDNVASAEPHPNSPLEGTMTLRVNELGGMPLWAVADGPRLVLGGGELQPSGFALRKAAGATAGLAGNQDRIAGSAHFEPASGATVLRGYTARSPLELLLVSSPSGELARVLQQFEQATQQAADFLGGKRCWRMQLVDGGFLTEMVALDEPGAAEDESLLGGRPLDSRWLAPIDPDAMLVYSAALNGETLLAAVRTGLREFGRQTGQDVDLETIDAELGIPLSEVFGQLGPGLAAYAKPLRGVAIPESYAWVELGDPEAFQNHVGILTETLGAKFPGFALRTRVYRVKNRSTGERTSFPISSLTIPPELIELPPPVSLSPAFTVVDGMLLVSLSPMHLKRELKRLYGGQASEGAEAGGADSKNAMAAWGVDLPATAESVIVMDWGLLIGGLVSMAKSLGPMLPIPFDAQALPEPETITQHFGPTIHYSQRLEGAIYRRHEASFGPEIWLAAVVGGMQAYRMQSSMMGGMTAVPPPVVAHPDPTAADDGQELATRMAMQKIRTAVAIYQLELGTYPAKLEALVQPTDSFPGGFIDQKEVPRDGWGRGFRYEPAADGTTYRLWSSGPNAMDENGGGDDISSR